MAIKSTRKKFNSNKNPILKPERDLLKTEIKTKRLLLKCISLKYKRDIFKNFNKKVTTYLITKPTGKIADTEKFINESINKIKNKINLTMVVTDRNTGQFLGCSGISKLKSNRPNFGIWLKLSSQGKGIGLETITALKKWAEKNLDYDYLRYPVDTRNIPSRKIAESLGGVKARYFKVKNSKGKYFRAVEYRIYKNK